MCLNLADSKTWLLQCFVEGEWINQEQGSLKKLIDYWLEELQGERVRILAQAGKNKFVEVMETLNDGQSYKEVRDCRYLM